MATVTEPRRQTKRSLQTKLLIDGKWRDSVSGKTFETINPATEEVIAEVGSHIANAEVGGAARLGGLTLRPVVGRAGKIQPEQVASTVRPTNVHYARTTLLAIENTHNSSGGTVLSADEMAALVDVARAHGLKVHVDGARIFNAAVALGVQPAVLARGAETLTLPRTASLLMKMFPVAWLR